MTTIPTEQSALFLTKVHAPYELVTRPVPRPGPEDVLIKIEATALNPADWKISVNDYSRLYKYAYPIISGFDGAGVIIEVGANVTGVKLGDRVLFQGWLGMDGGTLQQYAIIPGDRVGKIPDAMSFAEAATIPLCLATAAWGLCAPYSHLSRGGLGLKPFWEDGAKDAYKDTPILVIGGASSVGQFVIQIARYQGFSPIITTSSLKHTDFLRRLGADFVIDRNADIAEEIQKQYPGLSLPYIYDAVNPITQHQISLLAPGGALVSVVLLPESLNVDGEKRVTVVFADPYSNEDLARGMYARLPEFIANGIIKPSPVEKIDGGLNAVNGALERFEKGQVSGYKMVILPSETNLV